MLLASYAINLTKQLHFYSLSVKIYIIDINSVLFMTVELLVLNINLVVHKLRRFYSHITVVSVKRKKPTFEKKKKKKNSFLVIFYT